MYQARITLAIPPDVDSGRHAEIAAIIDQLNQHLTRLTFVDRQSAREAAACALFHSPVGACGFPTAVNPASAGSALAALRKTHGGAPKKLAPCTKCGRLLSARARRKPCPKH